MSESTEVRETVLEATGSRARLARVYAEALLAAAEKSGQAEAISDELQSVADEVFTKSKLSEYFDSAAVTRKTKAPMLAAAFDGRVSDLLRKFLGVLNNNNRLGLIRNISATYQAIRDKQAGRVRVIVRSAVALSPEQTNALSATLSAQLGKTPIISVVVEPDLLGGLIVQVGDRVYDSSVRTRLNTFRNHLMSSGSHGV